MAIDFQVNGGDVVEVDFPNPEKGICICQIEEGIFFKFIFQLLYSERLLFAIHDRLI